MMRAEAQVRPERARDSEEAAMVMLEDFLEDSDRNGMLLQLTIREYDELDFVELYRGMDELSRDALLRNLSARAAAQVREAAAKATVDLEAARRGAEGFLRKLKERASGGSSVPSA